ncbi:MAG: hypothetical protein K8S27_14435 [Candidatus Omnitrophica bacterium]|nr:hypothetical protein [Candidatus Omnitrophota bacterium]
MKKKYSIEVPIYSNPLEYLIELNQMDSLDIIMYGGVPDSPLNGGRFNYSLDGLFVLDRFLYRVSEKQLAKITRKFYDTITVANQNGISFLIAFTNIFVGQDELTENNICPVKWLVESGQKHGVKNGLIINNSLLEKHLRDQYGNALLYVSSCTKYVSPEKLLSPRETLAMYVKDSARYDYIVITPQDSRREKLLREVVQKTPGNIIAISNSYCADKCNSYDHYEYMSKENKKSLLTAKSLDIVKGSFSFLIPRSTKCSAFRLPFCKVNIEDIAKMQINSGIVHFKLGRGFGADLLDKLANLVLRHERETKKN